MFTSFKRESLRKLRMAEDKSPKGSIDEPIVDLIRLINDHPNYVRAALLCLPARLDQLCAVAYHMRLYLRGRASRVGDEQLMLGTHRRVLWCASRKPRCCCSVCKQRIRQPDHERRQVALGRARDDHD